MLRKLFADVASIVYIIYDLFVMKEGCIVDITVWDSFSGKVKIIKNDINKWLIEILDVSMCYPQQIQLEPGELMWIHRDDIYRDLLDKLI